MTTFFKHNYKRKQFELCHAISDRHEYLNNLYKFSTGCTIREVTLTIKIFFLITHLTHGLIIYHSKATWLFYLFCPVVKKNHTVQFSSNRDNGQWRIRAYFPRCQLDCILWVFMYLVHVCKHLSHLSIRLAVINRPHFKIFKAGVW